MGKVAIASLFGCLGAALAGADPTVIAHDRIRFSLPGDWTLQVDGGILQGSLAGASDGGMVVLGARDRGGRSLVEAFGLAVDASTKGRTLLKANPPAPGAGASKSGVPFVGQSRITRGAAGDVWMGLYYAFDVGGGAFQLLTFVAGSPETFKTMATASGAGLEGLVVVTPAAAPVPSASLGGRVGSGASVYQQTGLRGDEYVSGAVRAESARLAEIPFQLGYARRYKFLDTPQIGRCRDGTAVACSPSTARVVQAQSTLMAVPGDGRAPVPTRVNIALLDTLFRGEADDGWQRVMSFDRVDAMADGSVFFGLSLYGSRHDGYCVVPPGGAPQLVAGWQFMKGFGKPGWGSSSFMRPCPDGRSAWLVLSNDGPANIAHLTPGAGGSWQARRVQPTWDGKPLTMNKSQLEWGAAEPGGGYLWHEKDSFYRLAPDGRVSPLAKLPIPTAGVNLSEPVVLPNGDIWFGIATEYSFSSSGTVDQATGHYTHRATNFMVGDRSRLVRVRLDGQGGMAVGEISAEKLLEALRARGAAGDGGVFEPARLRIDHATGGLLVYDSHHGTLYSVMPAD